MAEMNIEYPNISEQTPEGQLQQVKDYLFLLADKLNLQDNSAEKVFQEVSKAIDAEAVATTDNEQASKLREYANLKALIIKTGDYSLQHSEEFEKILKATYSASSEMGDFDEELIQTVKENAEGIERLFDYTAGINNEDGRWGVGTKQFVKTGLLYYDEGQVPVFGVGVGVINSIVVENDEIIDLKQNRLATFSADEIAFWDNGNKVAYISGNAINFPAANIRGGSIHIGEEEHNFFKVDTTGNLQVGDYFSVSSAGLAKLQSANGKTKLDLSSGEMTFELTGEIEMKQSADGISFWEHDPVDETLTLIRYAGGISSYLNENNDKIYPTAKLSVFDVYDAESSKILGKLWNNGGTRSQLDAGGVYLRSGYDMKTEYASLDFLNDSACFKLNDQSSRNYFLVEVTEEGYRSLDLFSANGNFGFEAAVANGNGQMLLFSEGAAKGGLIAFGDGAELRLGGGDTSWRMAWNRGKGSYLQADHHKFLGKSDGLVTGRLDASECSAYIVMAKPTSSGGYVSIIVPSSLANGSNVFQIADDAVFWNFYVESDGTLTHKNGTNLSSTARVYSIR